MGKYKIKRGHKPDLDRAMKEAFKSYEKKDGRYFGKHAILEVEAWLVGKELEVKVSSKKASSDRELNESIKAYNSFLGLATGFTAKERRKKSLKRQP
jgi:hypothetical protein